VPLICTALAGWYAIDMTIENVAVTGGFGLVGYLMMRCRFPSDDRGRARARANLGTFRNRDDERRKWSIFFGRTIASFYWQPSGAHPYTIGGLMRYHARYGKTLTSETQPWSRAGTPLKEYHRRARHYGDLSLRNGYSPLPARYHRCCLGGAPFLGLFLSREPRRRFGTALNQ
jgi:hypothetical protein